MATIFRSFWEYFVGKLTSDDKKVLNKKHTYVSNKLETLQLPYGFQLIHPSGDYVHGRLRLNPKQVRFQHLGRVGHRLHNNQRVLANELQQPENGKNSLNFN